MRLKMLLTGLTALAPTLLMAQGELVLGYLTAETGPFVSLSRTNEVAARIAVDTCVGNDKMRANPGWHNLQLPFLADLAAAGFPAESIDVVVCTHLHVDHVGWNTMLVDGKWKFVHKDATPY